MCSSRYGSESRSGRTGGGTSACGSCQRHRLALCVFGAVPVRLRPVCPPLLRQHPVARSRTGARASGLEPLPFQSTYMQNKSVNDCTESARGVVSLCSSVLDLVLNQNSSRKTPGYNIKMQTYVWDTRARWGGVMGVSALVLRWEHSPGRDGSVK